MKMHQILATLLDAIFPPHCISCKCMSSWWCIECRSRIELIRREVCPGCADLNGEHACSVVSPLDALMATGFYHEPQLRSAITALKYQGGTCLIPLFVEQLETWRKDRLTPWPWQGIDHLAIAHVPATPSRVLERGFDQAALLAQALQEACVPWASITSLLERNDRGETQASLGHNELRRVNVEGAFRVSPQAAIPSQVVLVDDVFTTGSTMHEAARALKAAGVQKIYGFVLAIGA
jgi:ComF family protein